MNDELDVLPEMALHFELGGVSFSLPVGAVRELLPHVGLETLAEPPPDVIGVLRVRDQVVLVLDVRPRLHLPQSARAERIVVIERQGALLGLAVEVVHSVFVVEPGRTLGAGESSGLTRGLIETDGRLVTQLDLARYVPMAREFGSTADAVEVDEAESISGLHLTLSAGGERLALPVDRVQEILEYQGHTRVPRGPTSVAGVINLRGTVVPVLRLDEELGLPAQESPGRVVVLEADWSPDDVDLVGLLVDDVAEVVPIARDEVAPPPEIGVRIRSGMVRGVSHIGSQPVFLVDADRVLDLDMLSRCTKP